MEDNEVVLVIDEAFPKRRELANDVDIGAFRARCVNPSLSQCYGLEASVLLTA
jgi:hypothetical protein